MLLHEVASETGFFIHFVSEVDVPGFKILRKRSWFADLGEELLEFLTLQDRFVGNCGNPAVDSDLWRRTLGQVEVGPARFDEVLEKTIKFSHANESVCGVCD